ncbi:NAD-dependent epimerase/dehydratase family protein [Patescibacteria group bacterium]|nr:NAD-dependent epimerase/dehydratase family protein [Patescibacteria group bacterium]
MEKQTILITGAAGYVGEMLCREALAHPSVGSVIAIDKEPITDFLRVLPGLIYVQHNLADDGWQEQVAAHAPTVVVHAAWQIRSLYGREREQWRWNIEGSDKVFAFACKAPSVKTLIHFSTAASYSARADNTFEHFFSETDVQRPDEYPYAYEKRVSEEHLQAAYENVSGRELGVVVVRPAAITGPRGRYIKTRFGLQSAVEGNLRGGFLARLVTFLTAFMPATAGFARQFVHEDDVVDTVLHFATTTPAGFEVYNLTPTGPFLRAQDMATAVGKRVLKLPPFLVRVAFAFFWHGTRGRIPTAPGSWRFYAYPILMSGEKLAKERPCRYDSRTAFVSTAGRYEKDISEVFRRPITDI